MVKSVLECPVCGGELYYFCDDGLECESCAWVSWELLAPTTLKPGVTEEQAEAHIARVFGIDNVKLES